MENLKIWRECSTLTEEQRLTYVTQLIDLPDDYIHPAVKEEDTQKSDHGDEEYEDKEDENEDEDEDEENTEKQEEMVTSSGHSPLSEREICTVFDQVSPT